FYLFLFRLFCSWTRRLLVATCTVISTSHGATAVERSSTSSEAISSQGPTHDEIDFEFLGNLSGDPYVLHTNVFTQGKGNREQQQFNLWFDPTKGLPHLLHHMESTACNIFAVDGTPIRDFKNLESKGVWFPKNQPMWLYSSLWNADDWATRGGLVKTHWTQAPFTASFRNFKANACEWTSRSDTSRCSSALSSGKHQVWMTRELDSRHHLSPRIVLDCLISLAMASSQSSTAACFFLALCLASIALAGNFYQDVDITWGDGRAKILDDGQLLTLSLDKYSGSGFQSRNQYLYGKFDMHIKLVPGDSAGTVATFYLSSQGNTHDEIDLEFLGNLSGDPYVVHTNLYTQGKGDREQQFYLWFDPTMDFHTYSVLWNPRHVVFYVDGTPIREFRNGELAGVPYPKSQAMRAYASLWDADDWATRGGQVKTDWSKAPFTASYRNYTADGCVWNNSGAASCAMGSHSWMWQELDPNAMDRLKWVQKNYMIYNYCTDVRRFPQGLPRECNAS
ncbi:hypothetical protein BHM03_00046148, partial [Ensete ventricosum]